MGGAGGPPGFPFGPGGGVCQLGKTCMSGQQQLCVNDSDCPAGMVCTISAYVNNVQIDVCAAPSSARDAGGG
jgi:hypothetical protein